MASGDIIRLSGGLENKISGFATATLSQNSNGVGTFQVLNITGKGFAELAVRQSSSSDGKSYPKITVDGVVHPYWDGTKYDSLLGHSEYSGSSYFTLDILIPFKTSLKVELVCSGGHVTSFSSAYYL